MSFASVSDWRDVYVASAARGLSMAGDFLAATALALALQSAGHGGMAVAGLSLAATLPIVLLAPLTGRLADRVDSRTLLLGAGLVQVAVCLALAFASAEPVLVIALVGLLACGLAVTQPAFAALLPAMVREDDLPKASAINQTATMTGLLVGPALAGILVGQFGVRVPLFLDAATYLAIVVASLFLRTRRGGAVARKAADAAGTAWRFRRDPLLVASVLAVAGVVAGVAGVNVIDVFFIRETLGASPTAYGFVAASWMAGMVAGSWLLARFAKRWKDDGGLVTGMLIALGGACLAVLFGSLVPAAYLLVPLWLVGGAFNGGENVLSNVFMARRVPEQFRGRAFATMSAAVQGAALVGYLLGGLLLERFAPRPLMAAVAVAGLAIVAIVAVPVSRVARRERAAKAAAPAPAQALLQSVTSAS